ncbi:Inner centromere protein, partial [Calypte anna]
KERQRLESLRKKQEAEEQRRKKVEEEKRRRQAEMKQKREERLRKALQARERVEQMEEEKKKRMEQKILQSDEKVWLSQAREERVAEEQSKKKLSKKQRDAEGWKQKVPSTAYKCFLLQEEDEFEQQEPLQKRREDEVKGKGKRVLELKKLVEQRQVEQAKERYWCAWHGEAVNEQCCSNWEPGGSKPEGAAPAAWAGEESQATRMHCCGSKSLAQGGEGPPATTGRGEENQAASSIYCCSWHTAEHHAKGLLAIPVRHHIARRFLQALAGATLICSFGVKWSPGSLGPAVGSPKGNENYGMDLNSDDSTDDEDDPRKPVPAWADGTQLNQVILLQYYHPISVDQLFGLIPRPKLEDIFGKSKPRYFKRTSSAVWHSPP